MTSYNMRNPAIKRLMKEAKEIIEDPSDDYVATPLEDNIFEWHFTIRGPTETEFEGGLYHGRILLPAEYPMKPPNIVLLTPNGRFQVGEKICLSITGYHPEFWQPAWGIRTVCTALISFFPTPGKGAIGAIDYTPEERKKLAKVSTNWKCDICKNNPLMNLEATTSSHKKKEEKKDGEPILQISFTSEKEKLKQQQENKEKQNLEESTNINENKDGNEKEKEKEGDEEKEKEKEKEKENEEEGDIERSNEMPSSFPITQSDTDSSFPGPTPAQSLDTLNIIDNESTNVTPTLNQSSFSNNLNQLRQRNSQNQNQNQDQNQNQNEPLQNQNQNRNTQSNFDRLLSIVLYIALIYFLHRIKKRLEDKLDSM